MAEPSSPHRYIPQIDGLRAIAVLAVMLYHLHAPALPGGFTGVDVFFVISGYVVTVSLLRDVGRPLHGFLLAFYARRFLRIVPALVVVLVATSVLATLFIPNSWLSSASSNTGLAAFFGYSNLALLHASDGYFSPRVDFNPFTHTWSLAVEEQFYVLYPFVVYASLRMAPQLTRWRVHRAVPLIVLAVLSFAIAWRETLVHADRAFYLLPSRFWELAGGGVLALLHAEGRWRCTGRWQPWALWLGAVLVLLGLVFAKTSAFPMPWALLPVVGSLLLLMSLVDADRSGTPVSRMLGSGPVVWVGRLSYSLYLWHWPVYVLFRWTVGLDRPIDMALAVLLTVAAATASFYWIETPVRTRRGWHTGAHWKVVTGGALMAVAGWALSGQVFRAHDQLSLSVTRDAAQWYPAFAPVGAAACTPEQRSTDAGGLSVFSLHPAGCAPAGGTARRQLFVVGDSHAGAYSTLLYRLAQEHNVTVWLYSVSGCSLVNFRAPLRSLAPHCTPFSRWSLADIGQRASPGDVVLFASLKMRRLSDQWGTLESPGASAAETPAEQADRAAAASESEALVASLVQRGLAVVADAPKPVFRAPPFRCSDWFNTGNPVCRLGMRVDRGFLLERRQPVLDAMLALQTRQPRFHVWDPFPLLCPDGTCTAHAEDGAPLFFDADHLSAHGNLVLYPSLVALLDRLWAPLSAAAGPAAPPSLTPVTQ